MMGLANLGIVAGISLRERKARSRSCALTGRGDALKVLAGQIVVVRHSEAPTNLDRLMKAAHRMSPASFDVSQGAGLQLDVEQSIVEGSPVTLAKRFRINLLDLAKRPAQEIQIVDQEIQNDTAAFFRVRKPRFPAGV